MQVSVEVDHSADPTQRVLAMETVAREYCIAGGMDQDEAVMMLLTAAARIHVKYALRPDESPQSLAEALTTAIKAVNMIDGLRVEKPN